MCTILVADDEPDIVRAVEIYLQTEGYKVLKAYDGKEALQQLDKKPDLAIIDIMMPELDGLELTEKIRENSDMPIIILSAKSELSDKVLGLNIGADDYVTKPFEAVELLARVKSLLRRAKIGQSGELGRDGIYHSKGIVVDDNKKEVTVDGETADLTPYEYGILLFLIKNKGFVFPSEEIYEAVWEAPAYDVKKIVSVHISRLRNKIEINPRKPDHLISVYGMGYKLEDES